VSRPLLLEPLVGSRLAFCLSRAMWCNVIAEVNREAFDPMVDEQTVFWWKAEECPVDGCKHFKNAKAWSMQNQESVIAYVKHHLLTCNAPDHHISVEAADALLDGFTVDMEEWSLADRKQYHSDQTNWQPRGAKRERPWRDDDRGERGVESRGFAAPPLVPTPPAFPPAEFVSHVASAVVAKLATDGLVAPPPTKYPPATPPIFGPPFGAPPFGSASSASSPAALLNAPPLIQVSMLGDQGGVKFLADSLVRSEAAIKAAMQQCITNARNLQNELLVVQEALAVVRGTAGV
jgi:hypothetical protein